jgi:hypothetical protein
MRNILEYPITREEAVEALDRITRDTIKSWGDDPPIGNLDMLILSKVRDFILNTDESMIYYIFVE